MFQLYPKPNTDPASWGIQWHRFLGLLQQKYHKLSGLKTEQQKTELCSLIVPEAGIMKPSNVAMLLLKALGEDSSLLCPTLKAHTELWAVPSICLPISSHNYSWYSCVSYLLIRLPVTLMSPAAPLSSITSLV